MAHEPTGWRALVQRGKKVGSRASNWYQNSRVGKTIKRFGEHNGNVLAGGIAYYSLASIAAGLMLVATIASALLTSKPGWRGEFYGFLGNAIPGVVGSGEDEGLISEGDLTASGVAGAVGIVSFFILLNTASRYVGGLRAGLRTMLGHASSNPFVGKLRDLIALVSLLLIALLGVALQVVASRAAEGVLDWIGWEGAQPWALRAAAAFAGVAVDAMFVTVALVVLGKAVRSRRLWSVVMVVAVAMSILRFAVSASVAGAGSNPILAPFTAIITLLVFVDLVNRLLLLGASWLGTYVTATEEGAETMGAGEGSHTVTGAAARDTPVTTPRVTVKG